MASFDLLQGQLYLPDRTLHWEKFLRKSRTLLQQVLTDPCEPPLKLETQQDRVRLYVRHYRAAVAVVVGEKGHGTLLDVMATYNVHSRQVLATAKDIPLGEFTLLQIHKDTELELAQEIEEIRTVQMEISKPTKISERPYAKAALFQGLEGMKNFYLKKYKDAESKLAEETNNIPMMQMEISSPVKTISFRPYLKTTLFQGLEEIKESYYSSYYGHHPEKIA